MIRIPFGQRDIAAGQITPEQVVPELARTLHLVQPLVLVLWLAAAAGEAYLLVTEPATPILILIGLTAVLFIASRMQFQYERAEQDELVERSAAGMRGRLYEDDVTALPNSRHFVAELRRRMIRASRSGRVFALALAHIDGVDPGAFDEDQMLSAIGRAIRKAVDDGDFVARLEGMVFVAAIAEGAAETTADKVEGMRWGIATCLPPELADSVLVVTSTTLYAGETEVRDILRRAQLDLDEARHQAAEAARERARAAARAAQAASEDAEHPEIEDVA